MSGLLDWLFTDPTQSGGGLLAGLLSGSNPGAKTSTPLPATPAVGSPFLPRNGLLGDSPFASGIRGALAGLAGSTGYTGMAALGAGAQASTQAQRQRQQFQMQNILGGQDYQKGQQDLIGGNIGNIFSLEKVNAMIDDMNQGLPPEQQKPHVTMADLMANPSIVNSVAGAQGGQPQGGQPPSPPAGMQPIYGGGTGGDPQVAQAYGPSLTAGAPPAPTPDQTQAAAPAPDDNASWVQQQMASIRNLQWAAPEVYKEKLAEIQANPHYLALSAGTTATANEAAKWNSPQSQYSNVANLASAFQGQDQVKEYNDVTPTYASVVTAYNAYQPGQPAETQLPNDINFASGVLKMINPKASNLRPTSIEAVEEAKGYQALFRKVQQQLLGGTGLTPEVRASLMQVAKQHMAAYQAAYDTTLAGYQKRAKMLGPNVTDDMWTGGSAPGSTAASNSAPEGTVVSNGNQTLKKVNGAWVPQ